MNPSKPFLLVHVLYHPHSKPATALGQSIYRALNNDPSLPGLRIPVLFAPKPNGSLLPPAVADQGLDRSEKGFIIALADDKMDADSKWCDFIGTLWQEVQHCPNLFLMPIQLSKDAYPLDPRLKGNSFFRAHGIEDAKRQHYVERQVVIELCRFLNDEGPGVPGENKAPTRLFISHTKLDLNKEPRVVDALKNYLTNDQPIKSWVDSGDIPVGSRFSEEIEKGVNDTSLLVVLTDNYASREWCRREVLLAKKKQRPAVVVNALKSLERRSFPYLGNLPVIAWDQEKPGIEAERVVDLLLKETLRIRHGEIWMQTCQKSGDKLFLRAPELLTVGILQPGDTILYPDPPLGQEEMELFESRRLKPTTPLLRLASARPFKDGSIALSLSESGDMSRFGLSGDHFEHAMQDLCLTFILQGATMVYGGHLGKEGYTEQLAEMLRTHHTLQQVESWERLVNYVGWPLSLSTEEISHFKKVAALERVPRPDGIDEKDDPDFKEDLLVSFPAEKSVQHRLAWSLGMANMRVHQTRAINARIVMGGKFGPPIKSTSEKEEKWYSGRIPGTLEEVWISLMEKKPVFIIGAFGGVGGLLADLFAGKRPDELTWDFQKRAPFSEKLRAIYKKKGWLAEAVGDSPEQRYSSLEHAYQQNPLQWFDYPEITSSLLHKGLAGINPHLSEEEHRLLMTTTDVDTMICVVSDGLHRMYMHKK